MKIECFADFLMKRSERDRRGAPGVAASAHQLCIAMLSGAIFATVAPISY